MAPERAAERLSRGIARVRDTLRVGPGRQLRPEVGRQGMCHSHRRRWLAGKPLDAPVRSYQRYEEGPDGVPIRASRASSPKRKPQFAAEMMQLRELGLR
jgi:hypothetical protein